MFSRAHAVEEFLCFMPHSYRIAINCAKVDCELYNWNSETLQAVLHGIKIACDSQIIRLTGFFSLNILNQNIDILPFKL